MDRLNAALSEAGLTPVNSAAPVVESDPPVVAGTPTETVATPQAETPADETEVAGTPENQVETPAETPAQETTEANTGEAPAAETEVANTDNGEEVDPLAQDFAFEDEGEVAQEAQARSVSPEPNTPPPAPVPQQPSLLSQFKEAGFEFESTEQAIGQLKQYQEMAKYLENQGITSKEIDAAKSGDFKLEEFLTGEAAIDPKKVKGDDLLWNYIVETNDGITNDEAQDMIDGMDENMKKYIIHGERRNLETRRQEAIKAKRAQIDLRRKKADDRLVQRQQEIQQHIQASSSAVSGMEKIAGTNTGVDQGMRDRIQRVLADTHAGGDMKYIRQILFGNDPSNPDYKRAADAVAYLMYRGQVNKDIRIAAASDTRREIIQGGANLSSAQNPSSNAVTEKGQVATIQNQLQHAWNSQFGNN